MSLAFVTFTAKAEYGEQHLRLTFKDGKIVEYNEDKKGDWTNFDHVYKNYEQYFCYISSDNKQNSDYTVIEDGSIFGSVLRI